jgi:signal transduction histidine kinase
MQSKRIKKMNEASRMTSIARKINFEFWLRQFANFIAIDLILLITICVSFFLWREGLVPDSEMVSDRDFIWGNYENWRYIIETESGKVYSYYIRDYGAFFKIPALILLILQAVMLIEDLFHTKKVRHLMKPLNDIAVRTEKLSNMAFDSAKMESFEQAVSGLDPENPEAKVSTGDQDLRSLEIAINNLIERMRESHRQQDRFVSDASHELRTPISVIQGYVNMLDRWGKEDEKILEESIEAIKNESEHMKNLIEQLLFLARGDSGRNTLEFTQVNLTEIVEEVWEESEMIDEDHVYRFEGEPGLWLRADRAMLKQSLRILVQNAAKYSGSGDTIYLRTKRIDGRPAYIVQDEGIGMASSEVVHVFERFYRADAARSRSESGTGLGLSIAKWIIDAHKGEIEVLSRPEFGTRFTVKL